MTQTLLEIVFMIKANLYPQFGLYPVFSGTAAKPTRAKLMSLKYVTG